MHPNELVVREMLTAHGNADEDRLVELLADDVVYHVPGNNGLSGDHIGREQVFHLWERQVEIIGRRFVPEFSEILACEYHVVVLADGAYEDAGRMLEWRMANVYHLRDGRITECWIGVIDGTDDFDQFWSP
ncbi:nuclear transport factor 2 family protein [Streptomyces virginiae]|uniref:nuclear transport factor 2 family protein n=1 Tax=Streptomyces virginiae TaxID=1961 RepID=UPI0036A54C17